MLVMREESKMYSNWRENLHGSLNPNSRDKLPAEHDNLPKIKYHHTVMVIATLMIAASTIGRAFVEGILSLEMFEESDVDRGLLEPSFW